MGLSNNLGKLSNMITSTGSAVGIAQASPAYTLDVTGKLSVSNTYLLDPLIRLAATTSGNVEVQIRTATTTYNAGIGVVTSGYDFGFFTNNTTRMTITSAGLVGIGTSSPSYKLHVSNNTNGFITRFTGGTSSDVNIGIFGSTAGAFGSIGTESNHPFNIFTNGTDRMTITSGGSVGINNSNPFGLASSLVAISGSATSFNLLNIQDTVNATSGAFIQFLSSTASAFGSITRAGATSAVLYNTTSDYRLKEDLREIKGLEKVCAIKVYDFKWIENEYRMDGVLAHELAEVLPYAVNGEKDALNQDGTMKTQGVDYSKLVPILVKAIQEMNTKLDEQNQTIQSLQEQNQDLKSRLDKAGL